ncbi:hypothetical protein BKA64DRAFT_645086 [Cadophora sp. MPI-SDFR-AT-0126]|nr:hypothetical protein BKA64DRAFT_645086 [Leotiomycetes sp. MPI-SDFR-AT-0126]
MTLNNCTICDKETVQSYAKCKSAVYCSQECQKLDFPLHKLLCTKITTFFEQNPRPIDEDLNTAKNPEFFWIQITGRKFEFVNSSPGMKKYIEDAHIGQKTSRGDHMLDVFMGDGSYGRDKPNACISRLMHGYQWTDGGNPLSEVRWVGNIVVLGYEITGGIGRRCKTYRDVTVADLRFALDFLGHDVKLYETEDVNRFYIRDEKMWMKGVKISCSGDMKLLGKKRFRDVLVSRYNDICVKRGRLSTSAISGHLGFELMVMNCAWHKVLQEAFKSGMGGLTQNPHVAYLMLDAIPNADNKNWGLADPEKWRKDMNPTALIVRKDMGDITAKQIETLVAYCKNVVQEAMKGDNENGCRSSDERKAVVDKYMTWEMFRVCFEAFRKEKISEGDTSWTDAALPQVPAPERAELPKDLLFKLSMLEWNA